MLPGTERHPHARAVLGAALPPAGSPSHAYLFHGPAGSGKRTVARAFAAVLLADGAPDPDGAAARVHHGVHPDLSWVVPGSAAGILVGDVDEAVVAAAARTPFEARRRVFVIEDADELNDQAANRMLKTLEEPPSFAHLILLTSRPGEVMPTIASRCQAVRFDALCAEEIARRLVERDGIAPQTAAACARLGLGDGARARALAVGDGPALRAGAEAVARAAVHGRIDDRPWTALLECARAAGAAASEEVQDAALAEREFAVRKDHARMGREAAERARRAARRAQTAALHRGLALVGLWLRDVACLVEGVPELVHHTDRAGELGEDAAAASAPRLRAGQDVVDEARAALELNPNEELLLDAVGSRLARALRGG